MKIVLSVALTLLFVACGEESQEKITTPKASHTVTKESVKESAPVAKTTTKPAAKVEVKPVVTKSKAKVVDGKLLFNTCAGCHGSSGEKQALGKSQIIKGWSQEKVLQALNGYADGTYGGAMKAVMKGQAAKLTAQEREAVAKYISAQ